MMVNTNARKSGLWTWLRALCILFIRTCVPADKDLISQTFYGWLAGTISPSLPDLGTTAALLAKVFNHLGLALTMIGYFAVSEMRHEWWVPVPCTAWVWFLHHFLLLLSSLAVQQLPVETLVIPTIGPSATKGLSDLVIIIEISAMLQIWW